MRVIYKETSRSYDKGAILIMVAIIAASLIALIALAIDSSTATTTRQQLESISEMSALAALEQLFESDEELLIDRFQEALVKANKIATMNKLLMDSIDHSVQLGKLKLLLRDCDSGESCSGGEYGSLTPGMWYRNRIDTDEDSIPDSDPPCGQVPCFYPSAPTSTVANAVRVTTKLNSPLVTFFAQIFTSEGLMPSGKAVAVGVPRYGYFLIDLSASMTLDTHPTAHIACSAASNPECYARYGPGGALESADLIYNDTWYSPTDTLRLKTTKTKFAWFSEDIPDDCNAIAIAPSPIENCFSDACAWCGMGERPNSLAYSVPWDASPWKEKKHFTNDFQLFSNINVYDDENDLVGIPTSFYLDMWGASSGTGQRVEPLFSVLDGVNGALQSFIDLRVQGDKAALAGFDEFVNHPLAQTRIFPFDQGEEHFRFVQKATVTDIYGAQWDVDNNFITNALFPFPDKNTNINTAPHTLNFKSFEYDNACMEEDEARYTGLEFVDAGGENILNQADEIERFWKWASQDGTNFYGPNYFLYRWAKQTGGTYSPIRPVNPDSSPDVLASPGVVRDCSAIPPACAYFYQCYPLANGPQRQLFDPLNRTAKKQAEDALSKLMHQVPFMLVEEFTQD